MTHADDVTWMERAIELSRKCPPAEGAFSVGAIIVGADGRELAHGYSRETDAHVHAEESALAKLPADDPAWPAPRSTARWNPARSASPAPSPAPS